MVCRETRPMSGLPKECFVARRFSYSFRKPAADHRRSCDLSLKTSWRLGRHQIWMYACIVAHRAGVYLALLCSCFFVVANLPSLFWCVSLHPSDLPVCMALELWHNLGFPNRATKAPVAPPPAHVPAIGATQQSRGGAHTLV